VTSTPNPWTRADRIPQGRGWWGGGERKHRRGGASRRAAASGTAQELRTGRDRRDGVRTAPLGWTPSQRLPVCWGMVGPVSKRGPLEVGVHPEPPQGAVQVQLLVRRGPHPARRRGPTGSRCRPRESPTESSARVIATRTRFPGGGDSREVTSSSHGNHDQMAIGTKLLARPSYTKTHSCCILSAMSGKCVRTVWIKDVWLRLKALEGFTFRDKEGRRVSAVERKGGGAPAEPEKHPEAALHVGRRLWGRSRR